MSSRLSKALSLVWLAGRAAGQDIHSDTLSSSLFGQCGWNPLDPLRRQSSAACPLPITEDVESQPASWHPWTHRPFCAESNYCVFTNSMFHGNHGISIVTTPEIAASTLASIESAFAMPFSGVGHPPYEIRDIPGKGKGVIANRLIRKGEIFMVDYAAVLADVSFPGRVKKEQGRQLLETAILQLPNPESVLTLARSGMTGTPLAEDVVRTNTFSAELGDATYMALFTEISRMNHACNPNAFTRFSEKVLAMRAVAFRDIQPGEEVSISYSEFGLTYGERQYALKHRWGFTCTCELCSASKQERAASDERRVRIEEIREKVLKLVGQSKFHGAIKLNEELLALVEIEDLVSHLGEHYEIMARMYYAIRDMKNAERYGRLALADLEEFGGPDVYDSIKDLHTLLTRL